MIPNEKIYLVKTAAWVLAAGRETTPEDDPKRSYAGGYAAAMRGKGRNQTSTMAYDVEKANLDAKQGVNGDGGLGGTTAVCAFEPPDGAWTSR